MSEVKVGDRVRSFDFPFQGFGRSLLGEGDERAAYVEGIVKGIGPIDDCAPGCDHYYIDVDVDVFANKEQFARVGKRMFPPVNDSMMSSGVEVIK